MSEQDKESDSDSEPKNWLGDLVSREPEQESHWLEGLVKPAPEAKAAPWLQATGPLSTGPPTEVPPEFKALLAENPSEVVPEKNSEAAQKSPPPPKPDRVKASSNTKKPASFPKPLPSETPEPVGKASKSPPKVKSAEPRSKAEPEPQSESLEIASPEPPPPLPQPEAKTRPKPDVRQDEYIVRVRVRTKSKRERLVVYRALAVMLESGVHIFAAFEFLSHQAETKEIRAACRRLAKELAGGHSLANAAKAEPVLFSPTSARMLEVGMRTGKLMAVLQRMAEDEQQQWEMRQRLWSQLVYPLSIAMLALASAILLPPLALSGVLEQVVALTDEPPAITLGILKFSSAMSSTPFLASVALIIAFIAYILSQPAQRQRILDLEPYLWRIPWLGEIPRIVFSCRFLQLFALAYDVGLPVDQSLLLAAESTGSKVMQRAGIRMREDVRSGETLTEALAAAAFLPTIAVEAVHAGEQVGKISAMIQKVAAILLAELDYRIEGAMKLMEPALLLVLGLFVGVFAIGCLLPILKLAETL